eukprot:TRINITY_DN86955_c0_g1_i1.p2 TRINITY_DN86955_c0_g1~~TRINITY_DN86955_c0_g1_i1.p2  ORF type:complete len:164 (+),score=42.15 TRINITY_DN86955_c0_g1_i1:173-664(+)
MSEKAAARQSCTEAMGLNTTPASIAGWKQLILKEEIGRRQWREKFAPHLEQAENEVVERVRARQSEIIRRTKGEEEVLQEGISKEGKGRSLYLKQRQAQSPQQKYRRPITTSQIIGWKCNELPPVTMHAAHHGRKPVIRSNFLRSTGVFSTTGHAGNQSLSML